MNSDKYAVAGLGYAMSAFLLWGLAPVFFKLLAEVSSFEVLAHRVIWSVLILALVLQYKGQWGALRHLSRGSIKALFWSSVFVSVNWLVFIWAVVQGRVLETSLGYFINPLISVLFGMLFLGETLRLWQKCAIALAALGVLNQLVLVGYLPWVALALAVSFASYGLIRKTLRIDPVLGLFVETSLLLPVAIGYLLYLYLRGQLVFGQMAITLDFILICSGLMTTIPLLLFAAGTQRLKLSTIGIVQYTTPSMTFFLAVFVYQEPFAWPQLLTFILIWAGVLIFTLDGLNARGRA